MDRERVTQLGDVLTGAASGPFRRRRRHHVRLHGARDPGSRDLPRTRGRPPGRRDPGGHRLALARAASRRNTRTHAPLRPPADPAHPRRHGADRLWSKDAAPASSDAASLVPTDAVVYAEATIKPEGDQKQQLEDLLAKFPGGDDVGAKIAEAIEQVRGEVGRRRSPSRTTSSPGSASRRPSSSAASASATSHATSRLLIATDDEDAAIDAVKKSEPKAKQASYEGVDYLTFPDDDGDRARPAPSTATSCSAPSPASSPRSSASKGDGLAGTESYKQAIEGAAEDRLGLVYVDMKAISGPARAACPAAQALQEPEGPRQADRRDRLAPTPTAPSWQRRSQASRQSLRRRCSAQGSDLLGDVPADAWLALGQPAAWQDRIDAQLDQLRQHGRQPGADRAAAARRDRPDARRGGRLDGRLLDLRARRERPGPVGGALVVETTDEANSAKTLQAIQRLARTANDGTQVRPLGIPGDGFQLTTPERAAADLRLPARRPRRDRLRRGGGQGCARRTREAGRLERVQGGVRLARRRLRASTYLAIAPILKLVETTPAADDSEWADAKRYLEPLGAIVSGAKKDGDKVSSALRVTVP